LTTKYDDKIFELTGNWKLTNDIVRKIGGDKTAISNALKILELIGYLQTKPDKNKLIYKKNENAQSEFNFLKMMEFFESNQKIQINFIKQIPTIMKLDNVRLREKSLDLLERIQDDVDRAYLVMIQNRQHEEIGILSTQITQERKKILISYANKILNALLDKYPQKHIRVPIKKYFQNNSAKFEFKI
jgi:MinD-like ATPase involved in chromosome partitioning or flagellar assembly